jgi:hypothetical protein
LRTSPSLASITSAHRQWAEPPDLRDQECQQTVSQVVEKSVKSPFASIERLFHVQE